MFLNLLVEGSNLWCFPNLFIKRTLFAKTSFGTRVVHFGKYWCLFCWIFRKVWKEVLKWYIVHARLLSWWPCFPSGNGQHFTKCPVVGGWWERLMAVELRLWGKIFMGVNGSNHTFVLTKTWCFEMFKCYTGTIYRSSVEKERQSEMSCLLSFIVITLFTAGMQIGMLAIFSVASSFLFPEQANAVLYVSTAHYQLQFSCNWYSFLSVHRNERRPYFLCHPQHVDFRLKKKKNSQCYYSDLWALWLLGWRWVPLFLTMTHWWDLPLPGHVLFRIYSQGALLGRRLRNTGRNRWKIWATGRCCVCVCVCVC